MQIKDIMQAVVNDKSGVDPEVEAALNNSDDETAQLSNNLKLQSPEDAVSFLFLDLGLKLLHFKPVVQEYNTMLQNAQQQIRKDVQAKKTIREYLKNLKINGTQLDLFLDVEKKEVIGAQNLSEMQKIKTWGQLVAQLNVRQNKQYTDKERDERLEYAKLLYAKKQVPQDPNLSSYNGINSLYDYRTAINTNRLIVQSIIDNKLFDQGAFNDVNKNKDNVDKDNAVHMLASIRLRNRMLRDIRKLGTVQERQFLIQFNAQAEITSNDTITVKQGHTISDVKRIDGSQKTYEGISQKPVSVEDVRNVMRGKIANLQKGSEQYVIQVVDLIMRLEPERNPGALIGNIMYLDLLENKKYKWENLAQDLPMAMKGAISASRGMLTRFSPKSQLQDGKYKAQARDTSYSYAYDKGPLYNGDNQDIASMEQRILGLKNFVLLADFMGTPIGVTSQDIAECCKIYDDISTTYWNMKKVKEGPKTLAEQKQELNASLAKIEATISDDYKKNNALSQKSLLYVVEKFYGKDLLSQFDIENSLQKITNIQLQQLQQFEQQQQSSSKTELLKNNPPSDTLNKWEHTQKRAKTNESVVQNQQAQQQNVQGQGQNKGQQKPVKKQPEEEVKKQDPQDKNNLRRWGKGEGESEMMEELVGANVGKETVLKEMRKEIVGEVNVKKQKEVKAGHIELLREVHDEHGGSVRALVERMEKGEMDSRTVIALERKEGGEHLGMHDVRMLAEVLRHNEGCKEEERIKLPAGIEGSAIWWDAKLMNEAQKHCVQVVGVEGKGLAHGQHEPQYNKDRENYIAQQLAQLKQQGYNVVMPVGEAHVQGLQARLNANAAMEAMQGMTQQNHMQNSQIEGLSVSQHPTTPHTKQVYGKFSKQVVKNGSQNHEIA